jgi:hypothetical protein
MEAAYSRCSLPCGSWCPAHVRFLAPRRTEFINELILAAHLPDYSDRIGPCRRQVCPDSFPIDFAASPAPAEADGRH